MKLGCVSISLINSFGDSLPLNVLNQNTEVKVAYSLAGSYFWFIKIQCGWFSKREACLGGIGGVLRDDHGCVLCLFSIPVGTVDSNFAELVAVREALRLFSSSIWASSNYLLMESDFASFVSWINGHSRVWMCNFILNEIFSLINHL
ncbi:hypothetical protein L1049_012021 [Liquidambar formosana]|uniref:RNase H type-1 domain-containing protein n=1 Tax=Liquidambar formosana TaxID=63359 RepID=A0AAP0RTG3_LIQFO